MKKLKHKKSKLIASAYYDDDDDESKISNILCYDIFEQILSLLPVKSLLRFKSVSKQLRHLISSSAFVKKHHNYVKPVSQVHLTVHPDGSEKPTKNPWLVTTIPSDNLEFSKIRAVQIDNPFNAPIGSVFGSCNGLLLVAVGPEMFLWNPSTREHVKLFGQEYTYCWDIEDNGYDTHTLVGIGYNSVLDEYKVIVYLHSDVYGRELLIYSSKFGYKGKVPNDFPYVLLRTDRGVTVNGCPHWILPNYNYGHIEKDQPVLMYYDILDEKFKSLSTPREWHVNYHIHTPIILSILRGCLCATLRPYADNTTDVWVMNEYGVEISWIKLFVVPNSIIKEWIKPLGFMKNGDEVVLEVKNGTIVKYNLKTTKCKIVIISINLTCMHDSVEYIESLVSPRPVAKKGRKRKWRT